MFNIFQQQLGDWLKNHESISSTTMKSLLEDAIDMTKTRIPVSQATSGSMSSEMTAMMNCGDLPDTVEVGGRKELPTVDIFHDPGIWICLDEGCNTNCHGEEWAEDAVEKLAKIDIPEAEFVWVHRRVVCGV